MESIGLLVLALLGWFWFASLKAREVAVAAAKEACAREDLLLLDETVALDRLRPMRDGSGRLRLRREYVFEYSDTGNNRRPGSVVIVDGRALFLNIGLRLVSPERTLH